MAKPKQIRRVTPTLGDALLEITPQLVWTARPNGLFEYMNQRGRDYTGLTLEQFQSDCWAYLQFIHPDDQEGSQAHWQHALDTGTMYEHEERLRNGQCGEYRWFLTRAMPMRDKTGQILKWFGTSTDIEDQKRTEQPTGYATSERGEESPENRAKTVEMWLASEKTLSLQMLEGVEARGLIWASHTPQGEGRVLEKPL